MRRSGESKSERERRLHKRDGKGSGGTVNRQSRLLKQGRRARDVVEEDFDYCEDEDSISPEHEAFQRVGRRVL